MAEDLLRINVGFLRERMSTLAIKQWWLAEQIGMSRLTVLRWCNGQVTKTSRENLEKLAGQLDCTAEDLVLPSAIEPFATPADQKRAAALIAEKQLFEICQKQAKWELLEGILRTAMQPNLPKANLAEIYLMASRAVRAKGEISNSIFYADQAAEIGEMLNLPELSARGYGNKAISLGFLGRYVEALEHLDRAGELSKDPTVHARNAMHQAEILLNIGDFSGAQPKIDEALLTFAQMSFAHQIKACISAGLGQFDDAIKAGERALELARASTDELGVYKCLEMLALIMLDAGDLGAAKKYMDEGEPLMARLGFRKKKYHLVRARIGRQSGQLAYAEAELAAGLAIDDEYLAGTAMLHEESAHLAVAMDKPPGPYIKAAQGLYRSLGADAHVKRVEKSFANLKTIS